MELHERLSNHQELRERLSQAAPDHAEPIAEPFSDVMEYRDPRCDEFVRLSNRFAGAGGSSPNIFLEARCRKWVSVSPLTSSSACSVVASLARSVKT